MHIFSPLLIFSLKVKECLREKEQLYEVDYWKDTLLLPLLYLYFCISYHGEVGMLQSKRDLVAVQRVLCGCVSISHLQEETQTLLIPRNTLLKNSSYSSNWKGVWYYCQSCSRTQTFAYCHASYTVMREMKLGNDSMLLCTVFPHHGRVSPRIFTGLMEAAVVYYFRRGHPHSQ